MPVTIERPCKSAGVSRAAGFSGSPSEPRAPHVSRSSGTPGSLDEPRAPHVSRAAGFSGSPSEPRAPHPAPAALSRARFPAEPTSVPRSRRFVDRLLERVDRQLQTDSLRASAVLLTSELATNAVVHARTWFEVSIRTSERHVRIEVADTSEVIPQMSEITDDAEHGRGLRIVDAMASSWGVEPGHRGKTVWFELEDSRQPAMGVSTEAE